MPQRLDTVEDVERAFGLPPRAPQEPAGEHQAFAGAKPLADHLMTLSRSYEVRGIVFSAISFRPPRGHEFWEIGDVSEWQYAEDGRPFRFEKLGNVLAYAERCASIPGEAITGASIIEALDLRDTLAVRKAVMGFFTAFPETGSG